MKRIGIGVVLALGMVTAIGLQGASAHDRAFQSEVTLLISKATEGTAWHGLVTSSRGRCTRHRRVAVYRRAQGPDELIGRDVTGTAQGSEPNEYIVIQEGSVEPGTYVAIARRQVLRRTNRHRHVCARAVSAGYTVAEE